MKFDRSVVKLATIAVVGCCATLACSNSDNIPTPSDPGPDCSVGGDPGFGDLDGADTSGMHGCANPPSDQDTCVRACDLGNDKGVGKYCSRGCRQCRDNTEALICTVDFGQPAPGFCTLECTGPSDTTSCGPGAHCACNAMGCGCLPDLCPDPV